jgi:hypothetical protein
MNKGNSYPATNPFAIIMIVAPIISIINSELQFLTIINEGVCGKPNECAKARSFLTVEA